MTHCTMEHLIALRDGEGSPWAREHVATCDDCRAELETLHQRVAQLKALPARHPSRDRWPAVREALTAERRARRRGLTWRLTGLAAAAALAGVLALRALVTGTPDLHAEELAQAKRRSAQLEAQLKDYDPFGRVMTGREAWLTAELEDRIAVIDGALAQAAREAELLELWQQRVDLMQQLYGVRVTRAAYVGL